MESGIAYGRSHITQGCVQHVCHVHATPLPHSLPFLPTAAKKEEKKKEEKKKEEKKVEKKLEKKEVPQGESWVMVSG